MIIIERLLMIGVVVGILYWILTSKKLENWINFKFRDKPTTSSEIETVAAQVKAEIDRKEFLIKEKKKELEREARILKNINKK